MITPTFQGEIAAFIKSQIAKVRINDVYNINDFTVISVEGNKVNMLYEIPFGAVLEVNTMALLKENGEVISLNNVYLPINSDTNITHTFTVMEVF